MAAPIDGDVAALGKLVFEKSNFKHAKSKHKEFIDDHHFNYSISCVFPNCSRIPEALHCGCIGEKTFLIHDLPIVELISTDLIEAFIKRGKLRLLSHNTCIDSDDCVCVLPTGHLILHLSKDTYQQLGIEGRPSQFPKRKKYKYVVDIDLNSSSFKPGKKGYNRIKWCLQDRLNLDFNFLVTWTPSDDAVCSSSIQKYFLMKGFNSTPVKVKCNMRKFNDVLVPDIDPTKVNFDDLDYSYHDIYEWLGGISNGIDLLCEPDGYLSTYSFSGPTRPPTICSHVQYTGFFCSQTVQTIMQTIRETIQELKTPWCSVTVHGFVDSPYSWKQREHGFMTSGDNLYTFIIFPDDNYWLYSAYGSYDLVS